MMCRLWTRGAVWAACALVVTTLSGCTGTNTTGSLLLELVQTVLLGITAAGGYVLIQNA